MNILNNQALQQFKNLVAIRFQLYNSLFTSLPFYKLEKTGTLLSLFVIHCEEGFAKSESPANIVHSFFEKYIKTNDKTSQTDLLFKFIQYVERQVVLFDALEDAAFAKVNDMQGVGTLKHLTSIATTHTEEEVEAALSDFAVRLVLTAHPTQFYPGTVLGIINDITRAFNNNNTDIINTYLMQLGKTPFFNKQKPTPYDEAMSLVWYLENVFYDAIGKIYGKLRQDFSNIKVNPSLLQMGFWPGGDRDGNPFVTAITSKQVAQALRGSIVKCYYTDVRKLKRRLTFREVDVLITDLENTLYQELFTGQINTSITSESLIEKLSQIKNILIQQHNGLFVSHVESFIDKVKAFGLHFASLDIRQDSSEHADFYENVLVQQSVLPKSYTDASDEQKSLMLTCGFMQPLPETVTNHEIYKTVAAIKEIQSQNGVKACHRYIISQCKSAHNVMEVYYLFILCGYNASQIGVDIVPLFETIADLEAAPAIMKWLYENPTYKEHLSKQGNKQTIMVGFSDGTKDGGYLMANWAIYKAKEELTALAKAYGISVVFFDGRGGPAGRGGGKTHKFYAGMGNSISDQEIQLTVQGQTISSNFGTKEAAMYNMEQMVNAGIVNKLNNKTQAAFNHSQKALMQKLSEYSMEAYVNLKSHENFVEYISKISPLSFYAKANIGSRPDKRGNKTLSLNNLRAIPFVGSFSQIKQNITGYYGIGYAMQKAEQEGIFNEIIDLYNNSVFFKTLLDNCEMAMQKSYFPLTAFLMKEEPFSEVWLKLYEEYELTKKYLFRLSGKTTLMEAYPVDQFSVQMREKIILPLLTIQQHALIELRTHKDYSEEQQATLQKLAMRCSFGIINASRNSA